MSQTYPCYWLEESGRDRLSLRRYRSVADGMPDASCPVHGYHNVMVPFGEAEARRTKDGYRGSHGDLAPAHDDPRWPTRCDCGYAFVESDTWQVFSNPIYRRADTGEELTLREAPPGALWNAWWRIREGWTIDGFGPGPDGMIVYCKTPGGDWCIDSRASNCDRPTDNEHRCWVRHGSPKDPQGKLSGVPFHVDKNGHTCGAGAGSILCGTYHGFLHGGNLVAA